jgi:DNA-binding helix-hairpin-helix protein with protein kinase domain
MNTPQQPRGKRTVRDTEGIEYQLTERLAEGGQGVVYRTAYPRVLLKLSRKPMADARVREWFSHVCWVARQPLEGMHIAKPVALIDSKHNPGYVMELMDGLEPVGTMLEQSMLALQEGRGLADYQASGGVARRVRLLARLARLLADLHGRGLAYGDLSPANIFVSQSIKHDEVWLIDSDNISVSTREGGQKIHSPQFGAPEIMRGISGINSLTDSWSFGVLAFQLMTMLHPFKGDMVDEDAEREEQALCGHLPWIDHPDERQNACSVGLPRTDLLTIRLRALFEQCFNPGRDEPGERPTMATWAEGFEAAVALLAECDPDEGCGNSFLFNPRAQCAFCDAVLPANAYTLLRHAVFAPMTLLGDEATSKDQWIPTPDLQLLQAPHELVLRAAPVGTAAYPASPEVCRLQLDESGLRFTPATVLPVYLARGNGGELLKLTKPFLFTRAAQAASIASLHIGDPASVHAVWRFKW